MDCPVEEKLIREKLEFYPGVRALVFDLKSRVLTVVHQGETIQDIVEALKQIEMSPDKVVENVSKLFEGDVPDPKQDDLEGLCVKAIDKPKGTSQPACCSACANEGPLCLITDRDVPYKTVSYKIANMCCPVEENLIRHKLKDFPGLVSLEFNLLNRVLTISHNLESSNSLETALKSIDMEPQLLEETGPSKGTSVWKKLVLASVVAIGSELTSLSGMHPVLTIALAVISILLAGFSTYKKGWIAIKNLELNMNALMSVAVTGAAILGDFSEAAMVMVLFTLAEALEDRSLERARKAISGLMSLAPEKATVLDEDGTYRELKASEVAVGSRVRVRPGEKLSMDGKVITGSSTINEAPITGESKSVEKGVGDIVFAGTVNESGSFEYLVTEPYENSTLSRILKAVEEAQSTRAPIQRFVDSFAAIYTPAVFIAAILVALIPPLVFGGIWSEWVYRALITLVVACPCALVISTPVTIVSGLAAATRKGLLIKGGTFLEEGKKLKIIALDKTGTITYGKPVQTDMVNFIKDQPEELSKLVASLSYRSDHPVSKAIFSAQKHLQSELLVVEDFKALPGEGVYGEIGGRGLYLGNSRLINRIMSPEPSVVEMFTKLEDEGKSVVALFSEDKILGLFAVNDTIRKESILALEELRALGVKTCMLTGDNEKTAQMVASQVKVDEYRSQLLPQDKLNIVSELSEEGKVGMVGDGINDAPALAKADIGFAMGAAGTDTAIETAAVAIMDDDLRKIPAFVKLSRATNRHLWENISFSLFVKFAFLVLTFMGFTRMFMAVFADIGVCLIVVANGLRLLKK
jgi:Cd2+/Zn2+-exporting ATPase